MLEEGDIVATISDIAKKTNVSIATVSRVLNYDKSLAISEHKRQRILETAEKLNYVPPKRKAALRTKPVKIGLVHWYTMAQELEDPYYLSIRMGVEQECYKKDIELVKFFRDNQLTDAGLNHGLDGVIAIGKFSPEEVKILAKKVNHVVFVDSSPDDALYDSVVIDFHSASSQALHYLSQCGFEKIGLTFAG